MHRRERKRGQQPEQQMFRADEIVLELGGYRLSGGEKQRTCIARAIVNNPPILLADDVLGELDPERRRKFWHSLEGEPQVIATGTSLPDPELGSWQVFEVADGTFSEKPAGMETAS